MPCDQTRSDIRTDRPDRPNPICNGMALEFADVPAFVAHGYDTLIDVRSPAEFAEDHIPGAINLPVLSNEERAEVGTIYKQQSPFLGRKIGAAKVFHNAADHIAGPLAHHEGRWKPLVYCWRGGQRSGSFAWMLKEIGWRAETVAGGYRTWRRMVSRMMHDAPLPFRCVLIDGNTGTAKTDILHLAAQRGAQVLDLEGLAEHRGSLLGGQGVDQPSQKAFESRLAVAISSLDPTRPLLVEAESNRIGTCLIPPSLWNAMKQAPRINIEAPLSARTAYLTRRYEDVLADGPRLRHLVDYLRPVRGHALVDHWHALSHEGAHAALTESLMRDHYDPAYATARRAYAFEVAGNVSLADLEGDSLEQAATQVANLLEQLT